MHEIKIYVLWVYKRVIGYAWCNTGILGILPKDEQLVTLGGDEKIKE